MMARNRPGKHAPMPNESEPLSHGRRSSLARAYPAPWRWVAAALVALSRASLPAIAVAVAAASLRALPAPDAARRSSRPTPRSRAPRPGCSSARSRRTSRCASARFTSAAAACASRFPARRSRAWSPGAFPCPAPASGCACARAPLLRPGLEAPDLEPLLGALAEAGGVASAREALRHPFVAYAHAKRRRPRGLLAHPLFKFPGFGLLPTAVLFNAHQHIAYGGSLGQYYLEGLAAWLQTFAVYWATVCVYLVLVRERVSSARARASRSSRRAPDRRAPRGCVGPSSSPAGSSTTPESPRSCWPVSCSEPRYGVAGLKTDSAQPIRS